MLDFYQYFNKIPIPDALQNKIFNEENSILQSIDNLSQINIFLGANNSGKSKLIREIIRNPIDPIFIDEDQKLKLTSFINIIGGQIINIIKRIVPENLHGYVDTKNVSFNFNDGKSLEISQLLNRLIFSDFNQIDKATNELLKIFEGKFIMSTQAGHSFANAERTKSSRVTEEVINKIHEIKSYIKEITFQKKYYRVYIPSIRTLRTFATRSAGLAKLTLNEFSFVNGEENTPMGDNDKTPEGIEIENGEEIYDSILEFLTSGKPNRQKIADFEKFLKENFFDGQEITLIPYTKETKELHIKIGLEKEQPIFNLGDGLQMIIILTWPFFNYKYGIIAIEEPELFIHPGLQKKLIQVFQSHEKAKRFIFFIATHSNHILDATQNSRFISSFTIRKKFDSDDSSDEKLPEFILQNIGHGIHDALHLIGVNNSSVYLSNCTIWVEGITDKLYLSKYIEEYLKNPDIKHKYKNFRNTFKEGIHYSFVLTGGSAIIHWDFDSTSDYLIGNDKIIAKFLCGKAIVIVDRDGVNKVKLHKELQKQLGLYLKVLPVIEMENLLSKEVVVSAVKTYRSCSKLDESKIDIPTDFKWKKFRLGYIIDQQILKGQNIKKVFSEGATKKNKNVTIKDKVPFCTKSIAFINYKNMTQESKKVVETILDFIVKQNSF